MALKNHDSLRRQVEVSQDEKILSDWMIEMLKNLQPFMLKNREETI